MNSQTPTLDVREDIRNGCAPFAKIMDQAAQLRPGEKFLLVAPFEPAPLIGVLAKQGFLHTARRNENGDWEVIFSRSRGNEALAEKSEFQEPKLNKSLLTPAPTRILDVDARGLEPPQPMVKILEALASLPNGAELRAHTDRRPMHLYAQLEARSFTGETEKENDGSFITHIRRS